MRPNLRMEVLESLLVSTAQSYILQTASPEERQVFDPPLPDSSNGPELRLAMKLRTKYD